MVKIDIFGSCVTRDAFKYKGADDFDIKNYVARTSIESIYSKKIKMNLDEIKLPSAFQKRVVYWDLNKLFPNILANTESEYLIIDLIDARIRLLKTRDSILTRSTEFVKSGLNIKGTIILNEERIILFNKSINFFIQDITKAYNPENIILHEAYFKEQYIDKEGNKVAFENIDYINESNSLLKHYYELIKNGIPQMKIIKLDEFIADENHEWGLEPFHYEKAYYEKFNEELKHKILK